MILAIYTSCQRDKEKLSYNRHIRPILNENCLVCHGGVRQMGGFSLLFEEDAFGETESGLAAIVRGNHKKSELYRRLVHDDPGKRMPQEADPLSDEEIRLIAQWIDEGAEWEQHWSFQPPEMPVIPETGSEWPVNPIDQFVLKKLNNHNLQPEPEAEKFRLLRRLYLDVTGLPPRPDEITEFINDISQEAYEKQVDKLLASPHFGEKWASFWLDLARYANSKGYEKDPHRNIWRYRDWVISALNEDKPFDEFTIEQLAGDLLEEPSPDQLIATGFHRNTMTNTEGGTEDEEFRTAAVIDRINTSYEVWQGLTMSCVQCHDHPYDPFRQEDFYRQYAFFNNTRDADLNSDLPLLEVYEEPDAYTIKKTINELLAHKPENSVDPDKPLPEQIRSALFPRLLPDFTDDFDNVIIRYNGPLDNSSTNLNNQNKKSYRLAFAGITLKDLQSITINYSSEGDDAVLKVWLDSIHGKPLAAVEFNSSGATWNSSDIYKNVTIPVEKFNGTHNLIFEIINSSGKVPEGLVKIREFYLNYKNKPDPSREVRDLENQLIDLREKADLNLIMREKDILPRTTRVFEKGNWLLPADTVKPDIPLSLGEYPVDLPLNRIGFAKWLTSPKNPLTARVTVNRLWEQLFGRGIVATVEDFGTQGQLPSHPGLLDYLSIQFAETYQWSIKKTLKEILMSSTYRQSSKITNEKLERDPYNILLSRGPRFRLSAEQIRDQALAVSGLLNPKMGGKSDMPVQPEDTWQVIYSGEKWITTEEDKYRRSVYTYWKRTSPYPSYITFDAPSREFCVSRRIRTNTPLQALVTLNDPVYTDISEAFAERMVEYGKGNITESIKYGYRLALGKDPDERSLKLLMELYHSAEEDLNNRDNNLEKHLVNVKNTGPQGIFPMSIVASAIINLDEFLTKE